MSNITVSLLAGIICAFRDGVNLYNLGIILGILSGIIGAFLKKGRLDDQKRQACLLLTG